MAKGQQVQRADKIMSMYNVLNKVDPHECPFREFRDNELSQDYWGMGSKAFRQAGMHSGTFKPSVDQLWFDDQTQPLPLSVRKYLFEWKRAEDVALTKYDAEVVLFEEHTEAKMNLVQLQLTHPLVLKRSAFVRRVLCACFMLERNENLVTEHQWENFSCHFHDGWRPKYHVYSPLMKPGGGQQHRPSLSKNGCYLVRLFYLGAWRCVWVNDQVPVNFLGVPLLPFAPLVTPTKSGPVGKSLNNITSSTVHLWPLLICKALLKLAAPDISVNTFDDEDEPMNELSILHALTGCMRLKYKYIDEQILWDQIYAKVEVFVWDEDEETAISVAKKSVKSKPVKQADVPIRTSMVSLVINDTAEYPPYKLPGITPAFEMELIITMCRDLPLKKPLPEPEVPLWKTFRWVDWARRHGLYDDYKCPRTKFLKVNGLLKLSHAPHLLDVGSTESLTQAFRIEQDQVQPKKDKKNAEDKSKEKIEQEKLQFLKRKEELREWVLFESIIDIVKELHITFYPSQFQLTTCTSHLVMRPQKVLNRALDVLCTKTAPLYLQFDSPTENLVKFSLSALHPRILLNCNVPIEYYVEPTYILLEEFKWFEKPKLVKTKAFTETRGYKTFEVNFSPGRHYCRIWLHSQVHWHVAVMSESNLFMGTRDVIMCAAARECPWASAFLSNLGTALTTWFRVNRSNPNTMVLDREFFQSYQPDLTWDPEVVGYKLSHIHWMFRQALQSMLYSALNEHEFNYVCGVLKGMFRDPEFGIFKTMKPKRTSLREMKSMIEGDPCVCPTPNKSTVSFTTQDENKSGRSFSVDSHEASQSEKNQGYDHEKVMERLLSPPKNPDESNVCDVATDAMPCAVLREERKNEILRHEAATKIQAHWRGAHARKVLKHPQTMAPDMMKLLNDRLFGHIESLSALMNEFFRMFPTTKDAYSVSSALSGNVGLRQYHGVAHTTPKCTWVPYFQGTFYCHSPVKVHIDILGTLPYNTFSIYNNDSGFMLPPCYNTHFTYDIKPNQLGYTVMGHGKQKYGLGYTQDCNWQLTVLASSDKAFHTCDYDEVICKELPVLTPAFKLRFEEIFLPNKRNILGSVQLLVSNSEFVNFRVVSTFPDLEMIAVLRNIRMDGSEDIRSCCGRGEIFWPYIHLEGLCFLPEKKTVSIGIMAEAYTSQKTSVSSRALFKQTPRPKTILKSSKTGKKEASTEQLNEYRIEVIAPNGWPLNIDQWRRVDEVRNNVDSVIQPEPVKKNLKEKVSIKDKKEKDEKVGPQQPSINKPQEGDAYIILECSYPEVGWVLANRDDSRDIEYANTLKVWDFNEPGRNVRGATIRENFRNEYLESSAMKKVEVESVMEEDFVSSVHKPGPSPATESEMMEAESVSSTESLSLRMPEALKDKFKPLTYVPSCTIEKLDKPGIDYIPAMAESEKLDRRLHYEASMERMRELQTYNEIHNLERQKKRLQLMDAILIDGTWNLAITQAFDERDEAIAQETLARNLSATKKTKNQNTSTNASAAGRRGKGKKK